MSLNFQFSTKYNVRQNYEASVMKENNGTSLQELKVKTDI